jgi:pimeloyl-ACP methyl ester esterase
MPWYENKSGLRLWYEDHGSGPVVVLVHGWCMSSAVWRFQYETLASSFRLIAPDLRGHGKSEKTADGYHFEGFAADIEDLFSHLNIHGALLAGWSLGAQVALQACSRLGLRLSGLALISGTPRFTAAEDFPHALGAVEADGMGVKVRRNISRALDGFTSQMFAPGELDDSILAGQIQELLATIPLPDPDMAFQSLLSLATADMRWLLPGIQVPALIINGDRDRICLPQASEYLARSIDSSEHIVIHECGHAPFLTHSKQFNDCVSGFGRRIFEHG